MSLAQHIAATVRTARFEVAWSQRDLAENAGVAQAVVARIEGGESVQMANLEKVIAALGIAPSLQPPTVIGSPSRGDLVHRAVARVIGALQRRVPMPTATERLVRDGASRVWLDSLAFAPLQATVIGTEVKSEIHDLGATRRQVDRYASAALLAAAELGWEADRVQLILAICATRHADAFVRENRAELAEAFPVRGRRAMRALLGLERVDAPALVAIDPLAKGRAAVTSFEVDGRRTPLAHVYPSDVRRALEALHAERAGTREQRLAAARAGLGAAGPRPGDPASGPVVGVIRPAVQTRR